MDGHWLEYSACKNSLCPTCAVKARHEWLHARVTNVLPVNHVLYTLKLPEALRPTARSNQLVVYKAMFRAARKSLFSLARGPERNKVRVGAIVALHTWTRDLIYAPHLHLLVPLGVVSCSSGYRWIPRGVDQLAPPEEFGRAFGSVLKKSFSRLLNPGAVSDDFWSSAWEGHATTTQAGDLRHLEYLGRHRNGAGLSDYQVDFVGHRMLVLHVRTQDRLGWQQIKLPVFEFIRRVLSHAVPKGLKTIRSIGFLHHASRIKIDQVHRLVRTSLGSENSTPSSVSQSPQRTIWTPKCPSCGDRGFGIDIIQPKQGSREEACR